jgi:glycerophosphoryl diester phosphodiesterase
MKKLLFCTLLLFVGSCKKEKWNIVNLNGNTILALGHGGMGLGNTYPMNSAESILQCLNLGADGTEFDVQLTADSVLVLFHDSELSESTNLKGVINSMTWSEVKNAHYEPAPYLNYSIISIDQLFANLPNPQQFKFTFDCKLYTENSNTQQFYNTYSQAIIRILEKYQLEDNAYIESQSVEFIQLFKNKKSGYKFFIYPSSFEEGLNTAKSLGLFGITISTHDITAEQIKIAHDYNFWVTVWNTHTDKDNEEAIKKNPDCIQTDRIKQLLKTLKN